jgi:cytoskeletal protein CcmA (bactofilin family)
VFRKKHGKTIKVSKLSSLVADNVHIVGDVLFSGGLRVDGRIDGSVVNKEGDHGLLVVSDKGEIKGKVRAYDAIVNGSINGDVEVEHFLELQAGARISGNISYRHLHMECGATAEGKLERIDPAAEAEAGREAKVVDLAASHSHGAAAR